MSALPEPQGVFRSVRPRARGSPSLGVQLLYPASFSSSPNLVPAAAAARDSEVNHDRDHSKDRHQSNEPTHAYCGHLRLEHPTGLDEKRSTLARERVALPPKNDTPFPRALG